MTQATHAALTVCTFPVHDGQFRTNWQTATRRGFILTHPPTCTHRRALAELLALRAITGKMHALGMRELKKGGVIRLTAAEIPSVLAGSSDLNYLRPYARFLALSFNDLPIEVMRAEDWPAEHPVANLEAFELTDNSPWEEKVHIPDFGPVAPTRRAIEAIRHHLDTDADWKVWARLHDNAKSAAQLPWTLPGSSSPQIVLPNDGWILTIADDRIVDVRSAQPAEIGSVTRLLADRPAVDELVVAKPTVFALQRAKGHGERVHIVEEFLRALPVQFRRYRAEDGRKPMKTAIGAMMDAALLPVAEASRRAFIIRTVLGALPQDESHITLPDGTKAIVTGHALDRLVTRFNLRSPLDGLDKLHDISKALRQRHLPPAIQASKELADEVPAIHWSNSKGWTLVVAGGSVATVYFPR